MTKHVRFADTLEKGPTPHGDRGAPGASGLPPPAIESREGLAPSDTPVKNGFGLHILLLVVFLVLLACASVFRPGGARLLPAPAAPGGG